MHPVAAATGVAGLLNSLKHQQAGVRRHALKALGTQKLDPDVAIRQFRQRLGDADPAMRVLAVHALEKCGAPAVSVLIEAMSSGDDRVRREAVWALGRLGAEAAPAVGPLAAALRDGDVRVSQGAARSLGLIGPAASAAVPALMTLLHESNYVQCRLAAGALAAIGPAAVPGLVEGLRSPNIYVRCDAAWALAQMGPPARAAVPALLRILRSACADCLWKRNEIAEPEETLSETTPVFIPARKGTVEAFCLLTIKALGAIGPAASAAVPDLVALLRAGHGTAYILAAQAMTRIEPWTAPR